MHENSYVPNSAWRSYIMTEISEVFIKSFYIFEILKVKVKQYRYMPGVAQRAPGS
jgi:hypothetical protein